MYRVEYEYNIVSSKGYGQAARAKLFQFPLSLCYAQTAHKMQGQTVKAGTKVVIHWTKRMQEGMAYVMLGRSSRRQDIYITGELDISQIRCNKDALSESHRLLEIFERSEIEAAKNRSKVWKVSYLNVRSLNAHQCDVKKDTLLIDSDLLGLGETWIEGDNMINIDGYSGCFANYGKGKGVAGYSKMNLIVPPEYVATNFCSAMLFQTDTFDIVFLYLSHNYNQQYVFNLMNRWIQTHRPTAVMGDINENCLEDSKFERFMREKGFYQMVDIPTCETGSLLDHIYINGPLDQIGFFTQVDACYYSDHDIVSLCVTK